MTQIERIWEIVRDHPGSTLSEISVMLAAGNSRHSVSMSLGRLRARGNARYTGESPHVRWYVTELKPLVRKPSPPPKRLRDQPVEIKPCALADVMGYIPRTPHNARLVDNFSREDIVPQVHSYVPAAERALSVGTAEESEAA